MRPEEISNIIRSQIKHYETRINQSETGTVILIGDGIAFTDAFVVTQHDDRNRIFFQILCHAVYAARELQQLVDHAAR